MNNYEIVKMNVINGAWSVKALKTFKGREGVGINCNLYHETTKIAECIDSGNGGCLDIYYIDNKYRDTLNEFIKLFPVVMWSELGSQYIQPNEKDSVYDIDDETFVNILIDHELKYKELNKLLNRVAIYDPIKNEIYTYKGKMRNVINKVNNKLLIDHVKEQHPDGIVLNEIKKVDALKHLKTWHNG